MDVGILGVTLSGEHLALLTLGRRSPSRPKWKCELLRNLYRVAKVRAIPSGPAYKRNSGLNPPCYVFYNVNAPHTRLTVNSGDVNCRRSSADTKLRANSDAQDFIEPIDRDNIHSVCLSPERIPVQVL